MFVFFIWFEQKKIFFSVYDCMIIMFENNFHFFAPFFSSQIMINLHTLEQSELNWGHNYQFDW
jgi:hypothetical protein